MSLISLETFRQHFTILIKEFSKKPATPENGNQVLCDITYTITTISEPTLSKDFHVRGATVSENVQSQSDYFLTLYFWTFVNYDVMVWATDAYQAALEHAEIIGSQVSNAHLCFGEDYGTYGDENGVCPYRGDLSNP